MEADSESQSLGEIPQGKVYAGEGVAEGLSHGASEVPREERQSQQGQDPKPSEDQISKKGGGGGGSVNSC